MTAKAGSMQKVTLAFKTGDAPDREGMSPSLYKIEFVFGLGSSGLTPLEFALAEKIPGDEIHLQLRRNQIPPFFGHIRFPAIHADEDTDPIVLKVRVLEVTPASSQEVVRALAEIANCGDSCCGHH